MEKNINKIYKKKKQDLMNEFIKILIGRIIVTPKNKGEIEVDRE